MPRFPIKPIIKLTKEQWREVLRRVFEKEVKLTPKAAGELMKYEPPVTREMGTLARDIPIGVGEAVRGFERLPIEEARAKYFASPESYVTPSAVEPSVKEMAALPPPGSPLGASEMAKRIAYERLNFEPIIPSGTRQAVGVIRKEAGAAEKEALIKRAGLTLEDIRPGVRPEQVLAEKGIQTGVEVPPVAQVVQTALIGDSLWKEIGGAKSIAGKRWRELLDSSRGAVKSHFKTGRDYFISSYYRWKQDPLKFRKNYPREAKLLEQAQKIFEESIGPGVE